MCYIGKLSIGNLPVHPTPTKSAQDRLILSRIILTGLVDQLVPAHGLAAISVTACWLFRIHPAVS